MVRKLLCIIIVVGSVLMAQSYNVRHIKTDAEAFPLTVSSVQVFDSFDEPISSLLDKNFSVTVDGKAVDSLRAKTYKESGAGFQIMLCLDASGSMKGKPLATMKNAVLKFIDDMRSIDKLGIMTFADGYKLEADFSTNKSFLREKVNGITSSGNQTALYYGATKGLDELTRNKEKGGKILLLMGDGKDESNSKSYNENDVIEQAKKEGIPVFTIGYSNIDETYLQSLEKISEKTGGNFYKSPSDGDLEKQYKKLYRQILNIYLLNFLVTGVAGDGAEHIIATTVNINKETKTVAAKFTPPAGVAAVAARSKIIENSGLAWYYYAGSGLGLLLIGGLAFFFVTKSKKKKEEEQRKQNALLDAEKQKAADLARKLEEANKPKPEPPAPKAVTQSFDDKTQMVGGKSGSAPGVQSYDSDRTIIFSNSSPAAAQPKTLRMEFTVGSHSGRYDVTSAGATIGRKDGNSIVVKDATISGNHAKVGFRNGQFFVEDLGSSNGTFINARKIEMPVVVNHGDVFKFGSCEGTITLF